MTLAAESRPRVTGKDVISTLCSFLDTMDQASQEEITVVFSFIRGMKLASGSQAEQDEGLAAATPLSSIPS